MKRGTIHHHKTARLAEALGIERWGAVGILESLWHATAERTPQGDIGHLTDKEIAYYVGWVGDCSRLVEVLVECGWLDRSDVHRLVVHDWHDHADDATKKRLSRNGMAFVSGHVQSCPDNGGQRRTTADKSDLGSGHVRLPEPVPEPVRSQMPEPTSQIDLLRSGLVGLDGLAPLAALHRLGVNGPNARKIADAGITTECIRIEAEAIVGDTTVKKPAHALAARLMDLAGIGRKRKGGNTTTLGAEAAKLVDTINTKRGGM